APRRDNAPARARTLAAAGPQRLALGARAGQQGRRLGAGVGPAGEAPTRPGPRGARGPGVALQAPTQGPAPRRDQGEGLLREPARGGGARGGRPQGGASPPGPSWRRWRPSCPLPRLPLGRSGGCLAPHSHRREALSPTPRQPGRTDDAPDAEAPRWGGARLLKGGLALAMARCPFCPQGPLRMIAASTHGEGIRTILQPLKLAVDPPPIAPARVRQEAFAWSSACGPLACRCA